MSALAAHRGVRVDSVDPDEDSDVESEYNDERHDAVRDEFKVLEDVRHEEIVFVGVARRSRSESVKTDRPEDVDVVDGHQNREHCRRQPRLTDAHEQVAAERKPDDQEPVQRHEDDQPGGHVERAEQDEHEQLAADVGHVQNLELRQRSDPDLEGADVEDERVGDGEQSEVEVHRSRAHPLTNEHAERQRVADRSHQHDHRNY